MSDFTIKKPARRVECEHRGCHANGILAQRLDPLNWQPETKRLCAYHQRQLGFHPVDWSHGPYHGGKTPGA